MLAHTLRNTHRDSDTHTLDKLDVLPKGMHFLYKLRGAGLLRERKVRWRLLSLYFVKLLWITVPRGSRSVVGVTWALQIA